MNKRKLKRVRKAILAFLDKNQWFWDRAISQLLEQVDSRLFKMRGRIG